MRQCINYCWHSQFSLSFQETQLQVFYAQFSLPFQETQLQVFYAQFSLPFQETQLQVFYAQFPFLFRRLSYRCFMHNFPFPFRTLSYRCFRPPPIWLVVRRESRSSKINFQKIIFKVCRPVLVKKCASRFVIMEFRIWNGPFSVVFYMINSGFQQEGTAPCEREVVILR